MTAVNNVVPQNIVPAERIATSEVSLAVHRVKNIGDVLMNSIGCRRSHTVLMQPCWWISQRLYDQLRRRKARNCAINILKTSGPVLRRQRQNSNIMHLDKYYTGCKRIQQHYYDVK